METHTIDIIPPDQFGQPYQIKCSFGDLDRTTMDHLYAKEIAWGHFSNISKRARDRAMMEGWGSE